MRNVLVVLMLASAPALAGDPTVAGEEALLAARDAFVKGDFHHAIELARPAVPTNPTQAWRLIGASDCFLKDKPAAREAYDKLDEHGQSFVKYVCSRNGITLP